MSKALTEAEKAAREAQRAYNRAYYRRPGNAQKRKEYQNRYWAKKAAQLNAEPAN